MRSVVLMAAIMSASCANWSTGDTARQSTFIGLTLIDWNQTEGVTSGCTEMNPIIGQCGERTPLSIYFPTVIVLHSIVSALLPKDWRTGWQYIGIGGEMGVTWNNWRAGF